MFGLSFWEIGVVMLVALVVLGPKRLPALARSLGGALRSLQRASSDLRNAVAEPLKEVREPLQQMRDDLYQTVNHYERQARTDLEQIGAAEPAETPETAQDSSGPAELPAVASGVSSAASAAPPTVNHGPATDEASVADDTPAAQPQQTDGDDKAGGSV